MKTRFPTRAPDEAGNALILSVLILTMLLALAGAQFSVVHSSTRQSRFFLSRDVLRLYAESGINIALQQLQSGLSDGNIGTAYWTPSDDVGRDGLAGTSDEGEGDGFPGPGEPNVYPVRVGDGSVPAGLAVHAEPTADPKVTRLVSVAMNGDTQVAVEVFARSVPITLPRTGALHVSPTTLVDLNGSSIVINGNDANPDGTIAEGAAVYGISTDESDPEIDDSLNVLFQVEPRLLDQILGTGGYGSIGESSVLNLETIYSELTNRASLELEPGTYSDAAMGDYTASRFEITHVSGDVTLGGNGTGAGVLLVDGSLTITGKFEYYGLVLVKGDVYLSGGGNNQHVWGAVIAGDSFTAETDTVAKLSGSSQIQYSSEVLSKVETGIPSRFKMLFYREI